MLHIGLLSTVYICIIMYTVQLTLAVYKVYKSKVWGTVNSGLKSRADFYPARASCTVQLYTM